MMDLENRQTFNKKKTQTYIQIKPLIKDNYVQESKKRKEKKCSFIFFFLNRANYNDDTVL